jgi:hypothetical protein
MMRLLLPAAAALLFAPVAQAQALPPVPGVLADTAAMVCAKIDVDGRVDAFVLDSTGDKARDDAVVAWVRQLHWPKAKRGDGGRNNWFPMPLQFGNAIPPAMPASCAPPVKPG